MQRPGCCCPACRAFHKQYQELINIFFRLHLMKTWSPRSFLVLLPPWYGLLHDSFFLSSAQSFTNKKSYLLLRFHMTDFLQEISPMIITNLCSESFSCIFSVLIFFFLLDNLEKSDYYQFLKSLGYYYMSWESCYFLATHIRVDHELE